MDSIEIRIDKNQLTFGALVPFTGNVYSIDTVGGDVGTQYDFYVIDSDGDEALAVSENGTIALNSQALRDAFRKEPHEILSFHCYARANGSTVASGDIFIAWNPLWSDGKPGPAFTMKGDKGDQGDQGDKGDKGDRGESAYDIAKRRGFKGTEQEWLDSLVGPVNPMVAVQSSTDGKWHNVSASVSEGGEVTLEVAEQGEDNPAGSSDYVTTGTEQTITAKKTFSKLPVSQVTDPANETDGTLATVPWTLKRAKEIAKNVDTFNTKPCFTKGATFPIGFTTNHPIDLPGGSTCTTPTETMHPATKAYADGVINNIFPILADVRTTIIPVDVSDQEILYSFKNVSIGTYTLLVAWYNAYATNECVVSYKTQNGVLTFFKTGKPYKGINLYSDSGLIQSVVGNIDVRVRTKNKSYVTTFVAVLMRSK